MTKSELIARLLNRQPHLSRVDVVWPRHLLEQISDHDSDTSSPRRVARSDGNLFCCKDGQRHSIALPPFVLLPRWRDAIGRRRAQWRTGNATCGMFFFAKQLRR